MPVGENDTKVTIAGVRLDPLEEHVKQQNNKEDEPENPDALAAWIVQFNVPLDTKALAEAAHDTPARAYRFHPSDKLHRTALGPARHRIARRPPSAGGRALFASVQGLPLRSKVARA